jgi:UDP-N-acetylglucosamine 2-epimerase (non-hydrolysing)
MWRGSATVPASSIFCPAYSADSYVSTAQLETVRVTSSFTRPSGGPPRDRRRTVKLWFVLGTAAELIKVFPIITQAEARGIAWTVVSTGQSGINFWREYEEFGLPLSCAMTAVETGRDLAERGSALKWFIKAWRWNPRKGLRTDVGTGRRRQAGERSLAGDRTASNLLVVHGDTLSTIVGAHWGRRQGWPIVHVEAGLRSNRLLSPFPEEITRRLVSRWADFHMTPDAWSADNLRRAGHRGRVVDTGANTLVDALDWILEKHHLQDRRSGPYAVANLHRFENLNSASRWAFLVETLEKTARQRPVVLVLHPQTRYKIDRQPGLRSRLEEIGVTLVDRLPFREFIHLLAGADLVISDGGSNQEECFYLGTPCLLLRDTTERQVGLGSTAVLAGFRRDVVDAFLSDPQRYRRAPWRPARSPSAIILDVLASSALCSSTSNR